MVMAMLRHLLALRLKRSGRGRTRSPRRSLGAWVSSKTVFDGPIVAPDGSRATPEQVKELLDLYQVAGSHVIQEPVEEGLPVVRGVGACEERLQADGRVLLNLYPNAAAMKKNWGAGAESSSKVNNKKNALYFAFLRGQPQVNPDMLRSADYYREDGFRKVRPYFSVRMTTLVKDRTATLMDHYRALLQGFDEELLLLRIRKGLVFVNLEPALSPDQVLGRGDHISSVMHVHERAVLDQPIRTVYEDDDLLVVDKPSSVHASPAVGYRFNSLVYILAAESGHLNLRPCHRLDRLTSGIMILAKGPTVSRRIHEKFKKAAVKKEYLALVDGSFPDTGSTGMEVCDPIGSYIINHQGRSKVYREAKPAATVFHKLGSDGRFSLVRCVPKQGRTHQIRIHLSTRGYPIVGDHLYNPRDVWAGRDWDDHEVKHAVRALVDRDLMAPVVKPKTEDHRWSGADANRWQEKLQKNFEWNAPLCLDCQLGRDYLDRVTASEPMMMCLHSWKYLFEDEGRQFASEMPLWASDFSYAERMCPNRS